MRLVPWHERRFFLHSVENHYWVLNCRDTLAGKSAGWRMTLEVQEVNKDQEDKRLWLQHGGALICSCTSNARLYEVERNLEAERTDRLQATWSHGKRGHRVQVLVNGGMTRGLQPCWWIPI